MSVLRRAAEASKTSPGTYMGEPAPSGPLDPNSWGGFVAKLVIIGALILGVLFVVVMVKQAQEATRFELQMQRLGR